MNSITANHLRSQGSSHAIGLPASLPQASEKHWFFLVKVVLALATVALVTLTAIAAEQYIYGASPLSESQLIFLLQ